MIVNCVYRFSSLLISRKLFLVLILFNIFSPLYSQLNRLVTTPPIIPNIPHGGITFNITSLSNIRIDTLFVTTDWNAGTFYDLEVWYRPSPINGAPNPSEFDGPNPIWNNLVLSSVPSGTNLATIVIPGGIAIPSDSTYGFYIGDPYFSLGGVRYGFSSSVSSVSDSNVIISMGINVGYGWIRNGRGSANSPRYFSGGVAYKKSLTGVNDLSVDSILSPLSKCGYALSDSVKVRIKNNGLFGASNFTISYNVNGGAIISDTVNFLLQPGGTYIHTFDSTIKYQGVGLYSFTTFLNFSNDNYTPNDTVSVNIINSDLEVMNTSNTFYSNDFENSSNQWVSYGENNSWEVGNPSTPFIFGSYSGNNSYVTSSAYNYNSNELSFIESPCFDFSYYGPNDVFNLEFYMLFNSELGQDQLWMEYSFDNGIKWNKIFPIASVNFYNNKVDYVWEGQSILGAGMYIPVSNDLYGIAGNSNVKFRFAFKSNGANENDGFAIDNFILKMPNYVGLHSESFNVSDFSIYPNPAKTEITLLKMNHSEKYQFKIFDIFGRQVKELNWIERRQSLSIEALKTGIYLYQVIDDKGRIFEGKIVKE